MKYGLAIAVGFVAGIASGLIGIGGGILLIPGMVYILGIQQHMAHATSLAVIIPGAIVSALVYHSYGQLDVVLAVMFAVGGMAGSYAGSTIMPKVKPVVLKRLFAVLALLMAVKMGVQ